MTFEDVKKKTVDDLREVARLIDLESDAIEAGDLGRMDGFLNKLGEWRQMLMLRHEHRMGELEKSREVQPVLATDV